MAKRLEFDHVYATFTPLALADQGSRDAEFLGKLGLGQLRIEPLSTQKKQQPGVFL